MKDRSNVSFWITVVAIIVLLFPAACTREKKQALKGGEAPDFTVIDLTGSDVHLSDFKGRVILLEFWATWCPPCRESIPAMNEIYKRYNEKGLVLLGISLDKGQNVAEDLRAFQREYSVQYPVFIDSKNVSNLYGVYSIPTTVLIDKAGKIVLKNIGFSPDTEDRLSTEIERLL